MSRAKGLSFEEKRKRLNELFWERKEVFTLKELETLGPKHKGIVSQSVKDVLMSLISDGLVDSDKIGSGNFFWSLPSKAENTRKVRLEALRSQFATLQQQVSNKEALKRKAMEERQPTKERKMKMEKLNEAKRRKQELADQLKLYQECDPEHVRKLQQGAIVCRDAANRWTDNIVTLASYLQGRNSEVTLEKLLVAAELPKDLDTLD